MGMLDVKAPRASVGMLVGSDGSDGHQNKLAIGEAFDDEVTRYRSQVRNAMATAGFTEGEVTWKADDYTQGKVHQLRVLQTAHALLKEHGAALQEIGRAENEDGAMDPTTGLTRKERQAHRHRDDVVEALARCGWVPIGTEEVTDEPAAASTGRSRRVIGRGGALVTRPGRGSPCRGRYSSGIASVTQADRSWARSPSRPRARPA